MTDRKNQLFHGDYNESEVIHLTQIPTPEKIETVEITVDSKSYEVNGLQVTKAIIKLREAMIKLPYRGLPFMAVEKPQIEWRILTTLEDQLPLSTFLRTQLSSPFPSKENQYDTDTKTINYFGYSFTATDEIHERILSGRKISLKVIGQQLHWLTSYECDAYEEWEGHVNEFNDKALKIHTIMETAYASSTSHYRLGGILEDLPYDVVGAVKVNLSGLSEKSWGDGNKRNTVTHIKILDEPIGEMESFDYDSRSNLKGSVLCSEQKGRNMGLSYAHLNYKAKTLEDVGITCSHCLRKFKTILKKSRVLVA